MPGGHDGDDQLAAGKRVRDPLRLRCGAAGDWQAPRFGCHPCINTSSLAFSTQDLTEKLLPALGHAPVLVDLPEDSDA